MAGITTTLLGALLAPLKPRTRLCLENLVLRHQLAVLHCTAPRRVRLRSADRLLFVWLYRLWPGVLGAMAIVRPETVLRWHRDGFRAYWRWKSRSRPGRPRVPREVRELIRQMSLANRLWGCTPDPRRAAQAGHRRRSVHRGEVHGEAPAAAVSELGDFPAQPCRRRCCDRSVGRDDDRLQAALLPGRLAHGRRKLVHYAITAHPTDEWMARQILEAFPWDEAPKYLVRDRDAVYGEAVKRRVRGLSIRDRPIAPRSPWQNRYVERLIGSIRRECLDHMIVLGGSHLRRIMKNYVTYYNTARTHLTLGKDAPTRRPVERVGCIIAQPMVGGLHHRTLESDFQQGQMHEGTPPRQGISFDCLGSRTGLAATLSAACGPHPAGGE